MKLLQLRCLQAIALAGLMLAGGCSLLGGDGGSAPATPPMIGAAEPAKAAPKFRQRYRFATEVANTRKDHVAAQRKSPAQSPPAQDVLGQVVTRRRMPQRAVSNPAGVASSDTSPPGGLYPDTGAGSLATTAPTAFLTQRLPDVRQASFGEPPLF